MGRVSELSTTQEYHPTGTIWSLGMGNPVRKRLWTCSNSADDPCLKCGGYVDVSTKTFFET